MRGIDAWGGFVHAPDTSRSAGAALYQRRALRTLGNGVAQLLALSTFALSIISRLFALDLRAATRPLDHRAAIRPLDHRAALRTLGHRAAPRTLGRAAPRTRDYRISSALFDIAPQHL